MQRTTVLQRIGWIRGLGIAGAVVLSVLLANAAVAQNAIVVTVGAGSLHVSAPAVAGFAPVEITGELQTTTAMLAGFTVDDFRGTGAGWHLTVQARPFTSAYHDLAPGSLEMARPEVAGSLPGSTAPRILPGPFEIDRATPAVIARADPDEGIGATTFGDTTLTLTLPPDALVDTYRGTVTIDVVAGP
jgi:hypothetical protein